MATIIQKIRKIITPPYLLKDFLIIIGALVILIVILIGLQSGAIPKFLSLFTASLIELPTPATLTTQNQFVPGEALVKFKPGVTKSSENAILIRYGAKVLSEIPQIRVKQIKVPDEALDAVIAALKKNPTVEFAEPNFIATITLAVNDPDFSKQLGLVKVQAPQAWDITTGTPTVSIAVLDTGVEESHEDLKGKVIANKNFTTSPTVGDIHGHGTHVAGIAAAITNNSLGVASLGFNSTIMNVKVLGDNGSGSYSWVANGIVWAADNGAKVINMSLGGTSPSSAIENAVNYAWKKGVVVVASAGNSGSDAPHYPSDYQNVISVAATNAKDERTSWSNYGDQVDVAAPGLSIYSTFINNNYGYKSGTSMASPHVAGLAALVLNRVTDNNRDGFLNDEARTCIQNYADDIGVSGIGSGRINAYKAVECSFPSPDTTAPIASITSPKNEATVSGSIIVNVSATDNIGVTKLELYLDDALFATDTTSPYEFFWDTTKTVNGWHSLVSRAYDSAGNSGTSSIVRVNVSNISDTTSPTVTITSPRDGSKVSGTVIISATATDNVGIISMEVYIDGVLKNSSISSSISTTWNTKPKKVTSGPHIISVKAYDPAGNIGSSSITVIK